LIGREGSGFDDVGSKGEEDDATEKEGGDKVVKDGIGVGLPRKER